MDNTMNEDEDDGLRKEMLDKLENAPPVVHIPASTASQPVAVVEEIKKDFDEDYDYTRNKLKNLVDVAENAIEHYVDIAKERNSPRDFEVLATLLKNTGELVKSVIDTASSKAEIDQQKQQKVVGDKDAPVTNNTTIFVGSSKDLLERINKETAKVIDV
jgi:hypothetical protein